MGFRVFHNFSDGSTEDITDEVFETEEEADAAAAQAASDFSQGGDYLEEAGEARCPYTIVDWDIVEE